jgi:TolB-like protein
MRRAAAAGLVLFCLGAGAGAGNPSPRLALLPIDNLTGTAASFDDAERALAERLAAQGIDLAARDDVLEFLARRRVRYTGGLSHEMLRALHEELGIDAVVLSSAGLWVEQAPPRIAVSTRLVGTRNAAILWADETALAGEERPGLLGRGRVEDVAALADTAVERLAASLAQGLALSREAGRGDLAPAIRRHPRPARAFRPQKVYRAPALQARRDRPWSVAVLPFENLGGKSEASSILAGLVATHLAGRSALSVIEPGEIREALLRNRLIQQSGLSLAQTDVLRVQLQADLVVTGQVLEYEDRGAETNPKVSFSVRVIDAAERRVIWSCLSTHRGDDGPTAFDTGRRRTAPALASAMVQAVAHAFAGSAAGKPSEE